MQRIQRKRTPGFRLPKNTICVNRGTKWGNPFKVDELGRETAINRFKECLLNNAMVYMYLDEIEAAIQFNRFKWMSENLSGLKEYDNIACFCGCDLACHGDVLIELAKYNETKNT